MEVGGDHSATVIDVHDIPGQKEIADESDYSAVGCAHLLAKRTAKINTQMTGGESPVEKSAGAKLTGDDRSSRANERRCPHRRLIVRMLSNLSCAGVFTRDSRLSRRVQRSREGAIHCERLRNRRWNPRQNYSSAYRFYSAGGVC
jgi:hypothetical protein